MLSAVHRRYDLLSASVNVPLAVTQECRTALAALQYLTFPLTHAEKTKHVTTCKHCSFKLVLHSELLLVGTCRFARSTVPDCGKGEWHKINFIATKNPSTIKFVSPARRERIPPPISYFLKCQRLGNHAACSIYCVDECLWCSCMHARGIAHGINGQSQVKHMYRQVWAVLCPSLTMVLHYRD